MFQEDQREGESVSVQKCDVLCYKSQRDAAFVTQLMWPSAHLHPLLVVTQL